MIVCAGFGLAVGVGYLIGKTLLKTELEQVQLPMTSIDVMERQIELRKVYGNMEENFKTQNLNLEFISSMGKFYVETGETEVKALPYESPHACRLIVLPMDYTPELAQKLFHAASTVLEVLPKDLKVFQNPAEILHITLFHTSRPDSLMAAELDAKSEQYLINEKEKAQAILEASVKPHLVFDRITLAESGVLLALWVDETEVCFDLRNQLRAEFPDAPSKQTSILHSSLFRIITSSKLEKDIQEKVCEVCHRVSEELACTEWIPSTARYVHEHYFSTIEGQHFDFNFH